MKALPLTQRLLRTVLRIMVAFISMQSCLSALAQTNTDNDISVAGIKLDQRDLFERSGSVCGLIDGNWRPGNLVGEQFYELEAILRASQAALLVAQANNNIPQIERLNLNIRELKLRIPPESELCQKGPSSPALPPMSIASSTIGAGGIAPSDYTCYGTDGIRQERRGTSPPLKFANVPPKATKLLVLLLSEDDGTFLWWQTLVVTNKSSSWSGLTEGALNATGTLTNPNQYGDTAYAGPCPAVGTTGRYRLELLALTGADALTFGKTYAEVQEAVKPYLVSQATFSFRAQGGATAAASTDMTASELSCGVVQKSGGGTYTENTHLFEPQVGWVSLNVNAFELVDRVSVYDAATNAKIFSSTSYFPGTNGFFSWDQAWTFQKTAAQTKIRVVVEGLSPGTVWNYELSCLSPSPAPGATIVPTPIGATTPASIATPTATQKSALTPFTTSTPTQGSVAFSPPWNTTEPLSIFASSSVHTGNLGGLEGARVVCQNLANAQPHLKGTTWYPILSDSTWDVVNLTGRSSISAPIYNIDGSIIAATRAALWSGGPLSNGVKGTETGALRYDSVLTGTTATGLKSIPNCANWTSTTGNGVMGSTNEASSTWITGFQTGCSALYRIYCIGNYQPYAPTPNPTSFATTVPTEQPGATETPTDTPTATPSNTPSETPTITPTGTPSGVLTKAPSTTLTPTRTFTPTPIRTATLAVTAQPAPTTIGTFTVSPTTTPTRTPSNTPSDTPTTTPSVTPTRAFSNTIAPTFTPTPQRTPTLSITAQPGATTSATASASPTATPTRTPSNTPTETPTSTPSVTPTRAFSTTIPPTFTPTPLRTPTLSITAQPGATTSATATASRTSTPTATPSDTPSVTPTKAPTTPLSPTKTAVVTVTSSPNPTRTPTPQNTAPPVVTTLPTWTPSRTPTQTIAPTETPCGNLANAVLVWGNLDASASTVAVASIPIPGPIMPPTVTHQDIAAYASHASQVMLGGCGVAPHVITLYYFHTGYNEYTVRAYANNELVDPLGSSDKVGHPRFIGEKVLTFGGNGQRNPGYVPDAPDIGGTIWWNDQNDPRDLTIVFNPITQFELPSSTRWTTALLAPVPTPVLTGTPELPRYATKELRLAGNLSVSAPIVDPSNIPIPGPSIPPTVSFTELSRHAAYSKTVSVRDSLARYHELIFMFFHTAQDVYSVRTYVVNQDVDPTASQTLTGFPRFVGEKALTFDKSGARILAPSLNEPDTMLNIVWNNGADAGNIALFLNPITEYSAASNIYEAAPSATPTSTPAPGVTRSATWTPRPTIAATSTSQPTRTPSHTASRTPASAATPTPTPRATGTSTAIATSTTLPSFTAIRTPTSRPTATPVVRLTITAKPTATPSTAKTPTASPSFTPTLRPVNTPTARATQTFAPTRTSTFTPQPTRTATATRTPMPTATRTPTPTATSTQGPASFTVTPSTNLKPGSKWKLSFSELPAGLARVRVTLTSANGQNTYECPNRLVLKTVSYKPTTLVATMPSQVSFFGGIRLEAATANWSGTQSASIQTSKATSVTKSEIRAVCNAITGASKVGSQTNRR